jgi:hypothetical protein
VARLAVALRCSPAQLADLDGEMIAALVAELEREADACR